MVLSKKPIDALNSYGQIPLDKDIAITIFYLLPFYKTNKKYHACHDRFMKFKMNRYHSKSHEIRVGLGAT